jgi:hypothetical protein
MSHHRAKLMALGVSSEKWVKTVDERPSKLIDLKRFWVEGDAEIC